MNHFYKYAWDQQNSEWYVDRAISQKEFEQSYLQYWNRIKKGLGR